MGSRSSWCPELGRVQRQCEISVGDCRRVFKISVGASVKRPKGEIRDRGPIAGTKTTQRHPHWQGLGVLQPLLATVLEGPAHQDLLRLERNQGQFRWEIHPDSEEAIVFHSSPETQVPEHFTRRGSVYQRHTQSFVKWTNAVFRDPPERGWSATWRLLGARKEEEGVGS